MDYILYFLSNHIKTFNLISILITFIVHVSFAGAVAKDTAALERKGFKPILVPGIIWTFATLVGGVLIAAIYWFMHHKNLSSSRI